MAGDPLHMPSAQRVAQCDCARFFDEWAMACGHDGRDLRQERGEFRCAECDVPLVRRVRCVGR